MPASSAIEPTVRGGVAGEDDDLDALLEEEGDRLARLRPQLLGEHGEPERPQRRRAGVRIRRETRRRRSRTPTTRRPASWCAAAAAAELAEREQLGRAEHVADAAERLAAPAPAGEERDGLVDRLRGSRAARAAIASSVRFRASDEAA